MIYGVKVILTNTIGTDCKKVYEERILMVKADSFDDAFSRAEQYIQDSFDEYTNIYNETVKTENIEILDCFEAFDDEDGIQEVYSVFTVNKSGMSEEDYYNVITDCCDEEDLNVLRNKEYN